MMICILLCCSHASIAQTKEGSQTADTAFLELWAKNINAHLFDNPDSSLIELNKLRKASAHVNYKTGIYNAYVLSAAAYYAKSDLTTATQYYGKAIPFCVGPVDSMNIYYNIANCYFTSGDYKKSSENCFKVLNLAPRANSRKAQRTILNALICLSGLNKELGQLTVAKQYGRNAEQIARKYNFYEELVTILTNKALILGEQGKTDSASTFLKEAISVCEQNELEDMEGQVYEELGNVSLASGMYKQAINYFKQAADPKKCKDDYYLIHVYSSFGVAKALFKLKRYDEAEIQIRKTIRESKEYNVRNNAMSEYQLLSDICRSVGKWQNALVYQDSAMILKDSLTGVEKTAAVSLMEVKYKSAEKDRKLSENKLIIAKQQKQIDRKNILVLLVTAGVLLLLITGIGIYMQLMNRQRMREKENRIQVLNAAIEGSDNERTRIARELHDGVGSLLGASMIRFKAIQYEQPEFSQTEVYRDAMMILQDMGEEIRKAAHNLMPEMLMKESLPDAIKSFCDKVQENGTFRLDFQSYGDFEKLPGADKLNLYRIVQELVNNAALHANANRVLVQLIRNADGTVMSVEDNGTGFDVNEKKTGMGLPNIQTRVSSMGGHLTIESLRGKGTTTIIEIPEKRAN